MHWEEGKSVVFQYLKVCKCTAGFGLIANINKKYHGGGITPT